MIKGKLKGVWCVTICVHTCVLNIKLCACALFEPHPADPWFKDHLWLWYVVPEIESSLVMCKASALQFTLLFVSC